MGGIRRLTAAFLAAVLMGTVMLGEVVQVRAAETAAEDKADSEMTEEERAEKAAKEAKEKALKEAYEIPVQTNELEGWPEAPGTYGDAAIVMDADSGAILYAKNIDKKEYPASITKVLTALVALRYGDMNDKVTISEHALSCLGSGYASIGLKAGDVITMEQCLYATLLASANEAACALGETIAEECGEDYDWFIQQMNDVCSDLGGVNSNFVNTNGVFEEAHYTCARDMALIGKALFDYPEFMKICQTQQYTIEETDQVEEHVFQQKHHMLILGNADYYEAAIAGKTGYTTEAENTLITLADNGERRLVCVVLKTYGGHPYSDTKALLDYGFGQFENVEVQSNADRDTFKEIAEDAVVVLPEGVSFDQLDHEVKLHEGSRTEGTATYYYEDNPVGSFEVTVSKDYQQKEISFGDAKEIGKERKLWILIAAVVAVILSGSVLLVTNIRRRRKRRRRHRRKR